MPTALKISKQVFKNGRYFNKNIIANFITGY